MLFLARSAAYPRESVWYTTRNTPGWVAHTNNTAKHYYTNTHTHVILREWGGTAEFFFPFFRFFFRFYFCFLLLRFFLSPLALTLGSAISAFFPHYVA